MREYKNIITLTHNARGIYSLDTSIGCSSGLKHDKRGCYSDCYAAKSAKHYGYDFSKTVLRHFKDKAHERKVIAQINKIKLDFIRIGTSGDPSENWEHTVNVLKVISKSLKNIVIITKHWTNLSDDHLKIISTMNVCINTSVSALDNNDLLINSIDQYNRLKPYCKSVLRIVSADFNTSNKEGAKFANIQHDLFKNENTLDTVLRVNKNNPLVKDGIINIKQTRFLGKKALVSQLNKSVYFGKCSTCHEMCGMNIDKSYQFPHIIPKQLQLFKIKQLF